MFAPTRSPRKSKRQKREQADPTTIESKEILPGQHSATYWKSKAKEALDCRNRSLAEVSSPLPEINAESKLQYIRASLLDNAPDDALMNLTPEAIARSISKGKLDSSTITKALLLRGGIAAKLVSTSYSRISFH